MSPIEILRYLISNPHLPRNVSTHYLMIHRSISELDSLNMEIDGRISVFSYGKIGMRQVLVDVVACRDASQLHRESASYFGSIKARGDGEVF